MGYAVGAVPFPAAGVGAPINSLRCYWMAEANDAERWAEKPAGNIGNGAPPQWDKSHRDTWQRLHGADWRAAAAEFCPDAYGPATRVVRHRAYGNAINAEQARVFIECVMEVA